MSEPTFKKFSKLPTKATESAQVELKSVIGSFHEASLLAYTYNRDENSPLMLSHANDIAEKFTRKAMNKITLFYDKDSGNHIVVDGHHRVLAVAMAYNMGIISGKALNGKIDVQIVDIPEEALDLYMKLNSGKSHTTSNFLVNKQMCYGELASRVMDHCSLFAQNYYEKREKSLCTYMAKLIQLAVEGKSQVNGGKLASYTQMVDCKKPINDFKSQSSNDLEKKYSKFTDDMAKSIAEGVEYCAKVVEYLKFLQRRLPKEDQKVLSFATSTSPAFFGNIVLQFTYKNNKLPVNNPFSLGDRIYKNRSVLHHLAKNMTHSSIVIDGIESSRGQAVSKINSILFKRCERIKIEVFDHETGGLSSMDIEDVFLDTMKNNKLFSEVA
jgi:hypothetical protein